MDMNLDTGILEVSLQEIIPNRFQPRLHFDEAGLNDLAESIKQHGIIQPLVLRQIGDKYEIIAGERRFKAAGLAGLSKVPAVIANIDDNASAEVALVENIQRRNLTAIEEAKSYKNLLDKGYLTQDQLAKRLGISQSAISNKLRLLSLDDSVQESLLSSKISERHARALLQLTNPEDQKKWLERILRDRLTVRQLDMELKKAKAELNEETNDIPIVELTPNIDAIKVNAIDINPEPSPKFVEEFFPTQKIEIEGNEEHMPQNQDQQSNDRKFFNFLENESANLNVEETAFNIQPFQEEQVEILDMPMPPVPTPTAEDFINPISQFEPTPQFISPAPEPQITHQQSYAPEQPVIESSMFVEQPQFVEPVMSTPEINTFITPEPVITPEIMNETLQMPLNQPAAPASSNYTFNQNGIISEDFHSSMDSISQDPVLQTVPSSPEMPSPNPNYSFSDSGVVTQDIKSSEDMSLPELMPSASTTIVYENAKPVENVIDPVSMIGRLDPEYENKINIAQGRTINNAISMLREQVKTIEDLGFIVDIDEINFDDYYQMVVKIEKK